MNEHDKDDRLDSGSGANNQFQGTDSNTDIIVAKWGFKGAVIAALAAVIAAIIGLGPSILGYFSPAPPNISFFQCPIEIPYKQVDCRKTVGNVVGKISDTHSSKSDKSVVGLLDNHKLGIVCEKRNEYEDIEHSIVTIFVAGQGADKSNDIGDRLFNEFAAQIGDPTIRDNLIDCKK